MFIGAFHVMSGTRFDNTVTGYLTQIVHHTSASPFVKTSLGQFNDDFAPNGGGHYVS
jgi:hypothetical protein